MIIFNPWTVIQIGQGVFNWINPKIKYIPSKMVRIPIINGNIGGTN